MKTLEAPSTKTQDLAPPERFPYLSGLDGLRAVAVMAVLFYHADFAWAKGGFLGVEVFFVISGYLITSLLLVEWLRTDTVNLKAFWLRRARRLLPAVFLLLGVVAVGSVLFLRDSLYRLGGDILAASSYVTNWFLIVRQDSYFESFGRPPLLQHLWSLSLEEQFYVLWPILFSIGLAIVGGMSKHATIRRFRALVVIGVIGSTLLMATLFTPFEDPSRVYYGTDTRAAGILIGVAFALWWMPWRLPKSVSPRYKTGLTIVGYGSLAGLVVILAFLTEFSPWLYRGGFAVTSLLTAGVIAVIAHPAVGFGVMLSNPVMKWIGTRSYGIYLWHWPIFMITRPGFDVEWNQMVTFGVRLALTFGAAELSYRYVETPIRKLGYRTWMRRITRSLGVASTRTATAVAIGVFAMFALTTGALAWGAYTDPPGTVLASAEEGGETAVGDPSTETPTDTTLTQTDTTEPRTASEPEEVANEPSTPTVPATAEGSLPPTVGVPVEAKITLIGDSVLKGAEVSVLTLLGSNAAVDATVSRQFKHADDVASELRSNGELGDVVVIHLGTNGPFSSGTWDEVMTELSDVDHVFVVNAFVPRRWESTVNAAITSGIERFPDVRIIDYYTFGDSHPEYYNDDGVHLNATGRSAYAELLVKSLYG